MNMQMDYETAFDKPKEDNKENVDDNDEDNDIMILTEDSDECNDDIFTPSVNTNLKITNTDNLDSVLIASSIIKFLNENKIEETHFYQKVLRTSYLSFKNIVECPQEWHTLNDSFKLYFKRAHMFLNNSIEKKKMIAQAQKSMDINNESLENKNKKSNLIFYDISQITIDDGNHAIRIIELVIKKLNVNGLNRKILCDAVLGIPLNTFSFFCKRANKWSNQSDYAKESVMRMFAWFNDPHGIQKLQEWKKNFYTSK